MSKDLKAGIGVNSINRVVPGLIPSFGVARATEYTPARVKKWPVAIEPKLDGNRNTFVCRNGEGAFYTRSGRHVLSMDIFVPNMLRCAEAASNLPSLGHIIADNGMLNFAVDGEAMMGLFEDTGKLRSKSEDAIGAELHLYDIMSYDDFESGCETPFEERRLHLEDFVRCCKSTSKGTPEEEMIQIVPSGLAHDDSEVMRRYAQFRNITLASYLARGNREKFESLLKTTIDAHTGKPKTLEGAMIKVLESPYEKKKTTKWLKLKAKETEDLRIIGYYPGKDGTKYEKCLGGLIVDRLGVHVRVGGGFSDLERKTIWDNIVSDHLTMIESPDGPGWIFDGEVFSEEDQALSPGLAHSTIIGRLLEIEFHEVTPDGSLRHPRAVRFRDDKDGEL